MHHDDKKSRKMLYKHVCSKKFYEQESLVLRPDFLALVLLVQLELFQELIYARSGSCSNIIKLSMNRLIKLIGNTANTKSKSSVITRLFKPRLSARSDYLFDEAGLTNHCWSHHNHFTNSTLAKLTTILTYHRHMQLQVFVFSICKQYYTKTFSTLVIIMTKINFSNISEVIITCKFSFWWTPSYSCWINASCECSC